MWNNVGCMSWKLGTTSKGLKLKRADTVSNKDYSARGGTVNAVKHSLVSKELDIELIEAFSPGP